MITSSPARRRICSWVLLTSSAVSMDKHLTKTVLADKIKAYFKAEIAGAGAVRKTLHEAVNG